MQHVACCSEQCFVRQNRRRTTAEVHSTAMQIFDAVEHMAIYFVKDRLLKVLLKLAVEKAAKMCQDYSNQQNTQLEAEAKLAMLTSESSFLSARLS